MNALRLAARQLALTSVAPANRTPSLIRLHWQQERAIFGLRAVLLAALCLLLIVGRLTQSADLWPGVVLLVLSLAAQCGVGAVLWMKRYRVHARRAGLIADGVLAVAAVLFWWAHGTALFLPILFLAIGLVRLWGVGTAIQAGICAVLALVTLLRLDENSSVPVFVGVLLFLIALALFIGTAFALERLVNGYAREQEQFKRRLHMQTRDYHERASLLFELTTTMGASFNVENTLEAALSVGRLGIRQPQPGDILASAVLLFQTDDGLLHVAAAQKLARADEAQVCAGKTGLIAQALEQAEPMISNQPAADPELAYFSAFAGARSVLCLPLRAGYENFGVVVFAASRADAFSRDHLDVLTVVSAQVTMALQSAMLYRSLLDERARIVEVEEDARKKLARALHDGPTQSVSAIAMRLSVVYKMLGRMPDRVPEEIRKLETLARATTKEIRQMLFILRPLVLETDGLLRALEQFAEKMRDTHDQQVVIRMTRDVELLLERNLQGAIFYIVEEAVNNARKHAGASLITVTVAPRNDRVLVQIADNGKGFDVAATVGQNYGARGSLGMVNMRERAEILDGTFNIESAVGRGTIIAVTLPLSSERAAPAPVNLQSSRATGENPVTKIAMAAVERVQKTRHVDG